ncbi:MAG: bifunctional phosphopantothenoylcysteine decarboxylase/phosphopantothenate--cysteine ligase CoaBC [Flavobacteriaceae bacterium]|nr:bifunctional phosphopantothenoylcysteine decarboxylase/phosphopantothenate--cysteine ligase CoaBC [Flavobacteriaceae bacterium]
MSVLSGKKVLLGISAGIAAYKTAFLIRLFVKAGAEVKVVMTPASKEFVTPLTLSALSNNPVYYTFVAKEENDELWHSHVELGLWADFMLIAPATANTLAKMSKGTCDNLLLATYLSAKCPVYFAPTMDLDMYQHPSTKENIEILQSFGNIFIPATSGELASGLVGEGRMAEPEDIVKFIETDLLSKLPLKNKKVLITAGPTYEAIDPVRFIGNHSSGKMGFELAKKAASLGAQVILISGPSNEQVNNSFIQRIDVVSAEEMYEVCHRFYAIVDVAILSAAVSDYKPTKILVEKIKKSEKQLSIDLEPTKDILASLGKLKKNQLLIGFALETENEIANAITKIEKKNLDFIVLNSLNDKGAGFKMDTNKVTIIDKFRKISEFSLKSKEAVASDIFVIIISKLNE